MTEKESEFQNDFVDSLESIGHRISATQDWKSDSKHNGIWACSSILLLNKTDLKQVIGNIRDALLPSRIFYTSFKYGNFEGVRNGRYFTDLTESSFAELINEVTGFEIIEEWITSDVRTS